MNMQKSDNYYGTLKENVDKNLKENDILLI